MLRDLDLKEGEHTIRPSAPQPGFKKTPFLRVFGPDSFVRKNFNGDVINP